MKLIHFIGLALIIIQFSCINKTEQQHGYGHANEFMHQKSFGELVKQFEDPSRDIWQKPDTVIQILGDLQGKTVMDIGSGTGYFSFRLYDASANVICADVDDQFLNYISDKMKEKTQITTGCQPERLLLMTPC